MIGIGSIPWNFSSRSENPFEVARVGMRSVKTSTYSNTTQMAIQNYQLAFIDVAAPEGSGITVCRESGRCKMSGITPRADIRQRGTEVSK
jgi:hypothetical protein